MTEKSVATIPETRIVIKSDTDDHLVFGWANVAVRPDGTEVVDSHGDHFPTEDLEYAAYVYVLKFREADEMHTAEVKARLVESFFVTPFKLERMGLPANSLPQGWWVGFYVEDDVLWEKVKKGEYRMFSIAGVAQVDNA